MPIDFPCPLCGETLSVNPKLAGKKGLCPVCREQVDVPVQSSIPVRKFSSIPAKQAGPSVDDDDALPDHHEPCGYVYSMQQIPSELAVSEGVSHANLASNYLQQIVNAAAAKGWEFYRVDQIGIQDVPGCLGALFGARTSTVYYFVVTFRRLRSS